MSLEKVRKIAKETIITPSNLICFLSFILPMFLMHLIFHYLGMDAGGDKSLLIMDLKGQYMEFFASLRYIGKGDNSFFLSWSRSMGGNFLGLAAYYVASPLSFLTIFYPVEHLCDAIYMLTILKIGLCGLTFSVFLESAIHERKGNWSVVAFSVCYALMSYNIVYGMCLMWLDGVILLPVILLGIEKILKGKKGILYFVGIAALFICNYYTAYMVGIFAAIYIVYRTLSTISKDTIKEKIMALLRFAINTLFAFGVSMPLLLPVVKDLMAGKLAQETYIPSDIIYNFKFFDILSKFKAGAYDSITNTGALPSIFCGTAVIVLTVIFFFQKKQTIREKLGAFLILAFLLCSFWIFKLDVAWHGFQYPNWFPYRYAFLFSSFVLYIAHRAYVNFSFKKAVGYEIAAALLVFASLEMFYNGVGVVRGLDEQFTYAKEQEYTEFVDKTKPLVDAVKEKDDGFYRMEKDFEFSKNDAMLLGYNGMTHYSSTFNVAVNQLTAKMGIAQAWFWNSGYGSTLLTDSLFDVKYKMSEKNAPSAYQLLDNRNGVSLYENQDVLSIGFMADAKSLGKTTDWSGNVFENQNELLQSLMGSQTEYFMPLEFSKDNVSNGFTMTFTADSTNPVYLYMNGNSGWGTVYVNDAYAGNYFSTETTCNVYLGEFQKGENVVVRVECDQPTYYDFIYELDMDAFEGALEELRDGELQVQFHHNGKIKGTIKAKENQALFTSIPYDDGFTVKIDGKAAPLYKYADTFLMAEMPKGEHQIEISYISPGFLPGLLAAIVSAVLMLFYYQFDKFKQLLLQKKPNMHAGTEKEGERNG